MAVRTPNCDPAAEECADPLDDAIALFRETGQLLIVDTGSRPYPDDEVFIADPEDVVLRGRTCNRRGLSSISLARP